MKFLSTADLVRKRGDLVVPWTTTTTGMDHPDVILAVTALATVITGVMIALVGTETAEVS